MGYISDVNELLGICAELIGMLGTVTMDTPLYIDLDQKVESFVNRYGLTKTEQYQNISRYRLMRSSQWLSIDEARAIIQSLMALKRLQVPNRNKFDRIFISHSSNDIKYVKPLVELLESLGLNRQTMFCSSIDGYGIPLGRNIYDYLKAEFTDKNILVIMIMSDHYYASESCLNEMGATWVMSKEYLMILTDNFDFNQIKGAVDSRKISFKITDIARLAEFRDMLIDGLNLATPNFNDWIVARDKFIDEICTIDQRQ